LNKKFYLHTFIFWGVGIHFLFASFVAFQSYFSNNIEIKHMKILIIILVVLSFKTIYSQGEYINRGENACAAGVSMAIQKDLYGLAGTAGISTAGTLDFGFTYAHLVTS
jgi:hypothetical protein